MAGREDSIPLTFREATSGVLGSISLACWIFLLVPQLIENYTYGSAEAVSLAFLFVWCIGDLANLIGALGARLVPVVIAIGVYFCIADGVLISQCLYYNVKNARKVARRCASSISQDSELLDPTTPLLSRRMSENLGLPGSRRGSSASQRRPGSRRSNRIKDSLAEIIEETEPGKPWIKNMLSILGICAIGTAGWAIAWQSGVWQPTPIAKPGTSGDTPGWAQALGYISAVCYLGARIPQIIKNYRERSCEGLSLLFFIFSLLGNVSYGAGVSFINPFSSPFPMFCFSLTKTI